MCPVSGRKDYAFGPGGSEEWNVAALSDQTPISPESFLSHCVGPSQGNRVNVCKQRSLQRLGIGRRGVEAAKSRDARYNELDRG